MKHYHRHRRPKSSSISLALPKTPHIRSYKEYYRCRYSIDRAWRQGGKVTSCRNNIGTALVTSLQVQDPFIVVGCDNHRIEVFDSNTGNHIRTLLGHEGGVWALQFVKVSDDEYVLVSGGCDR